MENDNIDYSSLEESDNVFTKEVEPLPLFRVMVDGVVSFFAKIILWVAGFLWDVVLGLYSIVKGLYNIIVNGSISIYKFFKTKFHKFKYNDFAGRCSFVIFGASSFKNKQWFNGVLFLLSEIGFIIYMVLFGGQAVFKLGSLGTSASGEPICSVDELGIEVCEPHLPDNSIMILIYGLLTVILICAMVYLLNRSIESGYKNYRINNFDAYRICYDETISLSDKIDNDVHEAVNSGKMENFSTIHFMSESNSYIHKVTIRLIQELQFNDKKASSFAKNYVKYLVNRSIKDAKSNALINIKYETKIKKLNQEKNISSTTFSEKIENINNDIKLLKENSSEEKMETASLELDKNIAALESKVIKLQHKSKSTDNKISNKIKMLTKEIGDINKTYTSTVSTLSKQNYSKFSKFNDYYKHIRNLDDKIVFFNNYDGIANALNSGSGSFTDENAKNEVEKAVLKKTFESKIAASNETYDKIIEKRNSVIALIKETSTLKTNVLFNLKSIVDNESLLDLDEIQVLFNNNQIDINPIDLIFTPKQTAEILGVGSDDIVAAFGPIKEEIRINEIIISIKNNKYKKTIDKILLNKKMLLAGISKYYVILEKKYDGRLNALPTLKDIKDMRKEEIKNITHAYQRDNKYLKTNYKCQEFAVETAVNYMLLELDMDYSVAKELIYEQLTYESAIQKKHDKNESASIINEYINSMKENLVEEKAKYIEDHPTKYVGMPTRFVAQSKALFNENFHLTLLTLPVLGALLFSIIPLIFAIIVAFTNYSLGHIPPTQLFTWVGLTNFTQLFAPTTAELAGLPSAMLLTLGWTIIWAIVATFSNYILGIIIALMINKEDIKLKKLWRGIFVMSIAVPQFISLLSIGILLQDGGAFSDWLKNVLGFNLGFNKDTTNGALLTKIVIIIVNIWVGVPYTILSTTGILMNIPKDLYESARIDGAGPTTQFTKITMPYILFVTGPTLITSFIGNINNFNVIYFLTAGGPSVAGLQNIQVGHTDLLITYIYKIVTSANNPMYSLASCIGIVVFVICSFFSIIMYNRSGAVQKEDQFQ